MAVGGDDGIASWKVLWNKNIFLLYFNKLIINFASLFVCFFLLFIYVSYFSSFYFLDLVYKTFHCEKDHKRGSGRKAGLSKHSIY